MYLYLCECSYEWFPGEGVRSPGVGMCESPRIGVLGKGSTHGLNHVTVSPTSVTRVPSLHGKIPNERKQTLQNTTYLTRSNQSVLALLNGTYLCLPFPLGDHTSEQERAVPSAHDLVTGLSCLADLWNLFEISFPWLKTLKLGFIFFLCPWLLQRPFVHNGGELERRGLEGSLVWKLRPTITLPFSQLDRPIKCY